MLLLNVLNYKAYHGEEISHSDRCETKSGNVKLLLTQKVGPGNLCIHVCMCVYMCVQVSMHVHMCVGDNE